MAVVLRNSKDKGIVLYLVGKGKENKVINML